MLAETGTRMYEKTDIFLLCSECIIGFRQKQNNSYLVSS